MSVNVIDYTRIRIKKLQKTIVEKGLDFVIIMQPENRRYYSGFSGSNGWLIISPHETFVITDGRYYKQVQNEAPLFRLIKPDEDDERDFVKILDKLLKSELSGKKAGFEAGTMTVKQKSVFSEKLPGLELIPFDDEIEKPHLIKDDFEIAEIRKAIRFAEAGFNSILPKIKAGVTERDLAAELEYRMKLAGASKESFESIIASGENGALPHAQVSGKEIKSGEAIVIDWGASADSGYKSDATRTVFVGEPDPEMARIYRIVLKAQQEALRAAKPGMTCKELDKVARDVIEEAGYGEYFSHGLGHGVGLAVHEEPTLRKKVETILEPGMVVTIEPGIYVPGKGGVRIEDMVLITEEGGEVLTSAPKMNV